MKSKIALLCTIVLLIALAIVGVASADTPYPDGVEVFTVNGETYILAPDGSIKQVCPCFATCLTTTDTPNGDDPTPTPTGTPGTPEPPKEPCNRGIGNDSEGCDPGNSGGQGGGGGREAGEDRDENKK